MPRVNIYGCVLVHDSEDAGKFDFEQQFLE